MKKIIFLMTTVSFVFIFSSNLSADGHDGHIIKGCPCECGCAQGNECDCKNCDCDCGCGEDKKCNCEKKCKSGKNCDCKNYDQSESKCKKHKLKEKPSCGCGNKK